MTTERFPPEAIRPPTTRRRRSHPARSARIITTGVACTLTFGVVAALALNEPVAPPEAAANATIDPGIVDTAVASPARSISVTRRIHVLRTPSTTVTDLGTSPLVPAPAAAAPAFAPLPALRTAGPSNVSTFTARTARPHPIRRQATASQPVRRAKARSRAS